MYTVYKVDDGTGEVEVRLWLDSNAGDEMDTTAGAAGASKQKIVVNGYIQAWGKLRMFGNKLFVGAHVIRPLSNLNEVNYHLLEATAVHLYFTRGPPPNQRASGGGPQAVGAASMGSFAGMTVNGKPLPPMSPLARRLYQTLSDTPQSNEGLHVQNLAAEMGLSVSEVYKASEELLASGLIFTTVDDNTWAILEC
jgi:replication factor A2